MLNCFAVHMCNRLSFKALRAFSCHPLPHMSALPLIEFARASSALSLTVRSAALLLLGQALVRLVTVSSMHYCTSTSALSTSSSSRGLRIGYLISRGASRLDAFSVYPVRTRLPGDALGSTTGTPEVRPSRSSRTKDSSSQISYAHAG